MISGKSLLPFLTLLLSPLFVTEAAAHSKLQIPCNPPFNSYPFCNTSLPVSIRAQSIISQLTLPEKIKALCNTFSGVPRLGIPPYEWWSESLHGLATNGPGVSFDSGPIKAATMFPHVIVQAASFNRCLWHEIAAAIAVEARAMYNHGQAGLTFWAPNINIFRDPRWGRGMETPGEDPLVSSAFSVEYVKGFQGGDENENDELMLSACCKHFTAYDLEKWEGFSRYSFNAVVSWQDMEDTYQPPFKSCIQEGKASCLMCSYNSVNGVPACARGDLLHKVRTEWGFQGYITSDCDAIATIYEYHNYTTLAEDAVAVALKAGVDINCGTYMLLHTDRAIEEGKVQEKDVDRALLNLFTVQLRLGLFNGDSSKGRFQRLGIQDVCTREHKKLALDGARQGIVLLKNDKELLPLEMNDVASLAVIGPGASDSSQLGGDYTGIPCNPTTYLGGLKAYIKKTTYATGCQNVSCESDAEFNEAIEIAKEADYVIVVAGLDLSQETEDKDRLSLLLPGKQMALVSSVAAISKRPLILVLTGGGPLDVSFASKDSRIGSILWVGYPGETGGEALAEAVFGDFNPGGRLPMTWYPESFTKISMADMNLRPNPSRGYPGRTYRFYMGKTVYPFGHGLSYTSYKYKVLSSPQNLNLQGILKPGSNLHQTSDGLDYVHVKELPTCDSLRFDMQISAMNVGDMDGTHVVMLFSRAPEGIKGAPVKQLVGFSRISARAGETMRVNVSVDPCKDLSFADEHGKKILPLGDHTLMLEDLELLMKIEI